MEKYPLKSGSRATNGSSSYQSIASSVLCGFLLFQIANCVEFEDEFLKSEGGDNPTPQSERGFAGFLGGAGDWQSGIFDLDDLFSPQARSGLTPKKTSTSADKDRDREPLDVDFVSSSIGGHSEGEGGGEDGGVIANPPPPGISESFFPFGGGVFGSNFGFGNAFPFNFGSPNGYKPWWRGENVCVEREEDIEDWENSSSSGNNGFGFSLNFETCEDKPNKHICTSVTNYQGKKRSVTTTRQCCHGFAPSRQHSGHCKKVDLVPVDETATKMGASEFIRSAKNNGLEEKLSENITLFVPLDGAFTDFSEQMFESNLVVLPLARSRRSANDVSGISTKQLALNHIVKGFLNIEDLENEQLLPTEFENSTIRINVFPRPPGDRSFEYRFKYTANCVPMTNLNTPATNGIVHTVEKVLVPVTQTLMELVQSRSDLVVFRTVLEKTDFMEQLHDQEKTFTVFAPNDNAFSKLEPNIRRIVKDGNACTLNILKNHILDLTFCSAAVSDKAKTNTLNLLGEKLLFERQFSEQANNGSESQDLAAESDIVINKQAKVTESDLMATNGVLHVIDMVLETDSGTPITKVLANHNLTIFKQLVEASGLDDTINLMSNASFFVPIDKALENSKWKTELENNPESLKDNAELKKFLEYHIGLPYVKTCNLSEEMIQTATGEQLRINLYSTHPIFSNVINRATVNCARLISYDVDSCGSVLHQVDKALEPPKSSLLEILEGNPKYSKFLNLVRKANLTDLLTEEGKEYTIMVPSDDVFAEQEEWYSNLLDDSEKLERIVKSHILPDVLCCTGFVRSEWPFIRTIQTVNQKSVRIDRNRRPLIANAAVIKCDVVATNGVLHEVNDVIIIKESRQPTFF